MAKQGSAIQDEYFRKSLGIIICVDEYKDEDEYDYEDDFICILKKGWAYEYTYVYNRNKINLDKYMSALIQKIDIEKLTEDELNAKIMMVYFFLNIMNKQIDTSELLNVFEKNIYMRQSFYKNTLREKINYGFSNITKEQKEKLHKIKLKLFSKYNVHNFKDTAYLNIKDNLKMNIFLSWIFDFENISSVSIFSDVKFSEKDIDQILYLYIILNNQGVKDYDIEDLFIFYCLGLYTKYLIKAYKSFKEYYLLNNRESVFIEFENLCKQHESVKNSLMEKTSEFKQLELKVQSLERENKRLSAKLEESRYNKEELVSLREFMFSLDKKETLSEEQIDFSI